MTEHNEPKSKATCNEPAGCATAQVSSAGGLSRRSFVKTLGLGVAFGAFPGIVHATTSNPRVIVVGGGFAGATVAKYLRHWSSQIEVTLIEPSRQYYSCILSNLVLNGSMSLDGLGFDYAALSQRYGVNVVNKRVTGIDSSAHRVELEDGQLLDYDRLVVAPGVSFDEIPGLDSNLVPHAWKAGPQTLLLKQQLQAMPEGGTFVMNVPKAPYRCPPGPYERACLVADWLRKNKPGARVTVLDANLEITAERETFARAFENTYADMLEYHSDTTIESVDSANRVAFTSRGEYQASVLNVIPDQKAGSILLDSGLTNSADRRWAQVNSLSYESTVAADVHVIGDSQGTSQPKSGHIANAEAKVCADAILRLLSGGQPYEAPMTNSACYSPITAGTATWLTAIFAYDPDTGTMQIVPASAGEAGSPTAENYSDMFDWADNLFADTFA